MRGRGREEGFQKVLTARSSERQAIVSRTQKKLDFPLPGKERPATQAAGEKKGRIRKKSK